jgi:ankyrin repeat protein
MPIHAEDFFSAVEHFDIREIRRLLSAEPSLVRSVDIPSGRTALHVAAEVGREEVVALLVETGADVNAQTRYGWTALVEAILNGHTGIAEYLLEHKADPNLPCGDGGWTPLRCAVWHGWNDVARLLIRRGAKVDVFSAAGLGDTKRLMAILLADPEMAKVKDGDGRTGLHWAAQCGRKECAQILIAAGADLNAVCPGQVDPAVPRREPGAGTTALHLALLAGRTDVARLLIEDGAKPDIPDLEMHHLPFFGTVRSITPLHLAAGGQSRGLLQAMLNQRADLEVRDAQGFTPLLWAVWAHDSAAAGMLLAAGARVDSRSRNGSTPLSSALEDADILRLLLRHAGNALATEGGQLLRDAVQIACVLHPRSEPGEKELRRFKLALQLLIEHGVSPHQKDAEGRTIIWRAALAEQRAIAENLMGLGVEPDVFDAACLGLADRLLGLLQRSPDDIRARRGGRTPLAYAARYGRVRAVDALIALGADVDAPANRGRTPLHEASQLGKDDVVRLLLERGAKVDAKDERGCTALYLAAAAGHAPIVAILAERGADVKAADTEGTTPIMAAQQTGSEAVVEFLRKCGVTDGPSGRAGDQPE